MYLTAHRVQNPSTGAQGINTYLYLHGVLARLPLPEEDTGILRRQRTTPGVEPPGNRVRSYIDIIAPDGTQSWKIVQAFTALINYFRPDALPVTTEFFGVWFRFGMEHELAVDWITELQCLFTAADGLLGETERAHG